MRARSPLALVAALALLITPFLAAPVGASGGGAATARARVLAYWTPARMKAAIPRDLRPVGAPAQRAKPGSGTGVTGVSWTGGGPVLDRTGKVWFHMGNGDWICSGSAVDDGSRAGYSMVLTAGHCAVDETTGEFATNWIFIPNFDANPTYSCPATTYGCWTTGNGANGGLFVHWGFANAGSFNTQATTHDWAFAVVGPGGKSGAAQLDASKANGGVGGSYGIQFGNVNAGDRLAAFGYPAAGKYHGADLTWCAGNIVTDQYNDDLTWGMACGMTGGSSGGPWFAGISESNGSGGTLSSLNSYGYNGIKNMYGPKFNDRTSATYSFASNHTGNAVVGNAP
jgi:hypothetical protein